LAADAFDMADDFIAGESAFNFTVEVSILGDINGDSIVGILDLLALLTALMGMPGQWVDRVRQHGPMEKSILDMDPGAPGVNKAYGRRFIPVLLSR